MVAVEQVVGGEKLAITDHMLVDRMRVGDDSALAVLFSRHARSVFAFTLPRIHNRPDAEDIVQDAFIVMWERRHSLRIATDSVLPWLLTTARFKVMAMQRANRRHPSIPIDESHHLDATSRLEDEMNETHVALDYLDVVVARFTDADRHLYELCVIGKHSYQQAANELGLSHSTLRGRVARLKARIRGELMLVRGELR